MVDDAGCNPYWGHLGYIPISQEVGDVDPEVPADVTARAVAAAVSIQQHMVTIERDTALVVDCVVVGSGAGGGVVAAELAAAGFSVMVLEKGPHVAPRDLTTREGTSFQQLYEKAGLLTTSDGAMGILAGATMGGGTTVNWACCIPPPVYVREEWADPSGTHRMSQFAPGPTPTAHTVDALAEVPSVSEFDAALASVMNRIGATETGVVHNPSNQILVDGATKLGFAVKTTSQNLAAPAAKSAGWTSLGDRYGNKQGTMVTFLADAAATDNCRFAERCAVERVVTTTDPDTGRMRASGVVATTDDGHTVTITARRCVVVSAGSLHTPGVLRRSALANQHIGAHLRLHPVTGVLGRFSGRRLEPWCGAPMTSVCGETELGPRGDWYGSKLEVPSIHPGLGATALPWRSGTDFKKAMLDFASTASILALCRDKGEGSVELGGPSGFDPPKVHYTLSADDAKTMLWSIDRCIKIHAAAGADKIFTMHCGPGGERTAIVNPPDIGNSAGPSVTALLNQLDAAGAAPGTLGLFSAHQMGSCRMGWSADTSAVDCDGETWDCDELFVMDASVFPTASGANPMITTLAIAKMLGTRLASRLVAEDGTPSDRAVEIAAVRCVRRVDAARPPTTLNRVKDWVTLPVIVTVAVVACAYVVHCYDDNGL